MEVENFRIRWRQRVVVSAHGHTDAKCGMECWGGSAERAVACVEQLMDGGGSGMVLPHSVFPRSPLRLPSIPHHRGLASKFLKTLSARVFNWAVICSKHRASSAAPYTAWG